MKMGVSSGLCVNRDLRKIRKYAEFLQNRADENSNLKREIKRISHILESIKKKSVCEWLENKKWLAEEPKKCNIETQNRWTGEAPLAELAKVTAEATVQSNPQLVCFSSLLSFLKQLRADACIFL